MQINQQFGTLKIPGGDTNVVFLTQVVKFSETPIDETELAVLVIDHNVMWLDISMHNALGVRVVESLENLVESLHKSYTETRAFNVAINPRADQGARHVTADGTGTYRR